MLRVAWIVNHLGTYIDRPLLADESPTTKREDDLLCVLDTNVLETRLTAIRGKRPKRILSGQLCRSIAGKSVDLDTT